MPLNEHDLLQDVIQARLEVEQLENQSKAAKERREEAEKRLIEYLENRDLKGLKSKTLNAEVTKVDTLRIKINEGMQEKAFLYIDEELGRGDAIKIRKDIHHATLSSLISQCIKKGQSYPQEVFSQFWQKSLSIKSLK